jgi:hypothetical protein
VDRCKADTKYHLLVDGKGRAAMAFATTGANRHEVTQDCRC